MRKKHRTIFYRDDPSCNMACVGFREVEEGLCNEELGNYWDFHPGCYGNKDYGDYKGPGDLACAMKEKLESLGYEVTIKYNNKWKFSG